MVANIIQYVAPLKEYVPYYGVFSRATNIYSLAKNATNSTNPVVLTTNIRLTVLECCTPPPVSLTFHCLAAIGNIRARCLGPNLTMATASLGIVGQLYKKCL